MKELGSEVAQRPEGEVARQAKSSQSSQPNPNTDHDRTGKPVVCRDENHEQPTDVCSEQTSHSGLIPGGQNSSKRQTVSFLPVDPRDKSHKGPDEIDLSVPRRAQYLNNAWKKHQDAVYWVDISLAIWKGLTFYQTRSNAIILPGILPAHCIPKVERLKTGEVLYERPYLSPRPPPKISLKHDLNWTKGNDQSGSTVEHQPVGKLVQQSFGETLQAGSSKPTQFPKPIEDRTGKPVTKRLLVSRKENLVLQIERGNL